MKILWNGRILDVPAQDQEDFALEDEDLGLPLTPNTLDDEYKDEIED